MQKRGVGTTGWCALMVGSLWLLAAGQAEAASSNGPYYATPSWDQRLPASTRFVVLLDWGSQAVLDRETGLVWEQAPLATTHTWANARVECTNNAIRGRNNGGRNGWRLPSVHELMSLADPTNADGNPDLPPGHPFTNVQSAHYWSATTDAEDPTLAYIVYFSGGFVQSTFKSGHGYVWCVRGAMNAEAY